MARPDNAAAQDELREDEAGTDPRSYDYSAPRLECDLVLKGGITSGVVYPHAICELARTYRFLSLGGTSAGAIAAACAASAEHGRDEGGFERLAAVPDWLATGGNLVGLFQPQPETQGVYRLVRAAFGRRGLGRGLAVLATAIRSHPTAALAGLLPGTALLVLAALTGSGALRVAAVAAGVVLALLGLVLALGLRVAVTAPAALAQNGYGVCSGLGGGALTPWLADLLDDLAGVRGPLTFGDLRSRGIELRVVTTNVTHRRPHRMPWRQRDFLYDPDELRRLFPESVVAWMEAHPPPTGSGRAGERRARRLAALEPLRPFPDPDDLPVIVAVRMSLGFPFLFSAVPLHALDMTQRATRRAVRAVEAGRAGAPLRADVCWFSDGGITSNFPVHFFDTPLPVRPTFAIDVDGFHPDHPRRGDERRNVYLPGTNAAGLLETWHRLPAGSSRAALAGFAGGIVRTMQNHVDSMLSRQPGYRDRIVHVHTAPGEGGLNLAMESEAIDALTRRGQAGGRLLVERFAETPGTARGLSWDNHRWVRYRSAVASLSVLVESLNAAWRDEPAHERSYRELTERPSDVGPAGYRFTSAAQRRLAIELTELLAEAGERSAAEPGRLRRRAPRPEPVARIVPDD